MASPAHRPSRAKEPVPNLAHTSSNEPLHSTGFINSHHVRTGIVLALTAILAFVATFAAASYLDFFNTVKGTGVKYIAQKGEKVTSIVDPNNGEPLNIVLMGQDTRDGAGNSAIGGTASDEHHADTTMIVQISADRSYINLVSIPRDSMVNAPSCETSKGTMASPGTVMFNSIFSSAYNYGGDIASAASCTTAALAQLTGLNLSLFMVADFQGLKKMIDAVGGVDLCIPQDVSDNYTGLKLSKGMQHLNGNLATQYARLRHGIGDGSDIMRTTRQQYLIKALINRVLTKNILTNSDQLYQLVHTGISALQMSEQLADLNTLAGLAYSLRNFKTSNLYSRTVPTEAYPSDLNRVQWASGATALWSKMKADKPIALSTGTSSKSSKSSDTSSDSDSNSDSTTKGKVNSKTGLITESDGTLVDPKTGGTVDPETGIIKDPDTGYSMGLADQYLAATVCAVTAQK
ncbi:MAG: LCP family protein [Bifidobacteriaceae bacterium]|nr:LCP family protein [Bifidobacteriaceae bacterium]